MRHVFDVVLASVEAAAWAARWPSRSTTLATRAAWWRRCPSRYPATAPAVGVSPRRSSTRTACCPAGRAHRRNAAASSRPCSEASEVRVNARASARQTWSRSTPRAGLRRVRRSSSPARSSYRPVGGGLPGRVEVGWAVILRPPPGGTPRRARHRHRVARRGVGPAPRCSPRRLSRCSRIAPFVLMAGYGRRWAKPARGRDVGSRAPGQRWCCTHRRCGGAVPNYCCAATSRLCCSLLWGGWPAPGHLRRERPGTCRTGR
jgi:hypothetical protein